MKSINLVTVRLIILNKILQNDYIDIKLSVKHWNDYIAS